MELKTIIKYRKSMTPIEVKDNDDITIMSFNIRCVNENDVGNNHYMIRMPYIRKLLEEVNPDVIGFQEVKVPQWTYLKKILKNYDYEYTKRDDKKEGEANPVFFKKNRFICVIKNTFWLSDTHQIMSNTWNGRCYRICSYVCLKDKKTNKEFYVFNTHLDHINEVARLKGVQLINKLIKSFNKIDTPHLIIGDMNDFYGTAPINELFKEHVDASSFNNKKEEITFHDYGRDEQKIDYIALSKSVKQIDYKVIATKYGDIYPSDHYPIEVTIKL